MTVKAKPTHLRCTCGSTRLSIQEQTSSLGKFNIMTLEVKCRNCGREDLSFFLDGTEVARKGKSGRWIPRQELTDALVAFVDESGINVHREEVFRPTKMEPPRQLASAEYTSYRQLGSAMNELMSEPVLVLWVLSWVDKADKITKEHLDADQAEIDKNGHEAPARRDLHHKYQLSMLNAGCPMVYYSALMAWKLLTPEFEKELTTLRSEHPELIEAARTAVVTASTSAEKGGEDSAS